LIRESKIRGRMGKGRRQTSTTEILKGEGSDHHLKRKRKKEGHGGRFIRGRTSLCVWKKGKKRLHCHGCL